MTRYLAASLGFVLGFASAPVFGQSVTEDYTYDALGRLISVSYDSGTTITYEYDDAGNRTRVIQGASQASAVTPLRDPVDPGDAQTFIEPDGANSNQDEEPPQIPEARFLPIPEGMDS